MNIQGKPKAVLLPPGLSTSIPISAMFPHLGRLSIKFQEKMPILGTQWLHCWILKLGLEWDVFVAASLVHLYCRFGFSGSAYLIFKDMPNRDMGCWNSMISGFCQNGNAEAALSILGDMGLEGIEMDSVTVATVLSICAQMNDVLHGALIHLFAIKHGLELMSSFQMP
ncbi:UNVERIFIED_CONTAM: Pentatricopeptide repeat-containing protein [Sesamum radiatum]|uniref:Pentatricopeptide repeat-containing protein n=1 Tax=Sesamum radiatum TaxID=300843 RepID=A0AAW2MXL7_SESRA